MIGPLSLVRENPKRSLHAPRAVAKSHFVLAKIPRLVGSPRILNDFVDKNQVSMRLLPEINMLMLFCGVLHGPRILHNAVDQPNTRQVMLCCDQASSVCNEMG